MCGRGECNSMRQALQFYQTNKKEGREGGFKKMWWQTASCVFLPGVQLGFLFIYLFVFPSPFLNTSGFGAKPIYKSSSGGSWEFGFACSWRFYAPFVPFMGPSSPVVIFACVCVWGGGGGSGEERWNSGLARASWHSTGKQHSAGRVNSLPFLWLVIAHCSIPTHTTAIFIMWHFILDWIVESREVVCLFWLQCTCYFHLLGFFFQPRKEQEVLGTLVDKRWELGSRLPLFKIHCCHNSLTAQSYA